LLNVLIYRYIIANIFRNICNFFSRQLKKMYRYLTICSKYRRVTYFIDSCWWLPSPPLSERRMYCVARRDAVCVSTEPLMSRIDPRRISLGGEGNALYRLTELLLMKKLFVQLSTYFCMTVFLIPQCHHRLRGSAALL